MAGYDSFHLSPVDKPRKFTNLKTLVFFSAYMVVYVGVAMYAFITGDATNLKLDSTTESYFIKIVKEIINSKWIILGFLAFSILSTIVSVFLLKCLSRIIMLIAIVLECLAVVVSILALVRNLLYFQPASFLIQLIQTAIYSWALYVTLYMVSKIGTRFMSKVVSEACRAVFQFPVAIMLSILFTVLIFLVQILGISVLIYLYSINYPKFPSLLLVLFHFLNVYGTMWLTAVIILCWQMVLYGTFSTWFWTMNKSTISSDTALKFFCTTFRYHIGTAAYGSSIWVIFPVILIMIKNLSKRTYESLHNIFVMIVCWLTVFIRLSEISIGITAIHGKSFKKSADTVCQLFLRFPLRFFSITKAFSWCAGVLAAVSSLIVIIVCVAVFYSKNMSTEMQVVAVLTAMISIIFVILPIIVVLNAAVTSVFFCILEDFEQDQEDRNRTYFMKASIKNLMLQSE